MKNGSSYSVKHDAAFVRQCTYTEDRKEHEAYIYFEIPQPEAH